MIASSFGLLGLVLVSAAEWIDVLDASIWTKAKFSAWKEHYGKTYDDEKAEAAAFEVFKEKDAFIRGHNNNSKPYRLGHNAFSDVPWNQFRRERLGCYKSRGTSNKTRSGPLKAVPESVDWTKEGVVTAVKDQGSCGSCWAFSTTGALEGAYAIASGDLVALSEQELVDCDPTDDGCEGGLMDHAFQYIMDAGGICTDAAYEYDAVDETCMSKCSKVVTLTAYEDVPAHDEEALKVAVAQQPVSVAIEADTPVFQSYQSGILDSSACGDRLDHGVLIVGYGTSSEDIDYWKVKNSWGSSWGDNGFVLIERGNNICGIASEPSFPTGATHATLDGVTNNLTPNNLTPF